VRGKCEDTVRGKCEDTVRLLKEWDGITNGTDHEC